MDGKIGKVYRLFRKDNNETIYIGSTTLRMNVRMNIHRFKTGNNLKPIVIEAGGWNNIGFEVLEKHTIKSRKELEKYEGARLKRERLTSSVRGNKNIPGRGRKEYYKDNREKLIKYQKKYYRENTDKVRDYYIKNRDKRLEYQKEYNRKNKDKYNEYQKEYRQKNKDKTREYAKQYRNYKKNQKLCDEIIHNLPEETDITSLPKFLQKKIIKAWEVKKQISRLAESEEEEDIRGDYLEQVNGC